MKQISQMKNYIYGAISAAFLLLATIMINGNKSDLSKESASDKNILVIDAFDKKEIYINDDDTFDITHGELISKIIESGLPDYNVDKMEFNVRRDSDNLHKQRLFESIINNDRKYKAANISCGIHVNYNDIIKQTGINVTPYNIFSKAKEVKSYIKNHPDKDLTTDADSANIKMGGIADFMDVLDSLGAKGTKIYISTCNQGPNHLNLLSLVDGAVVVGAVDNKGIKEYSSDNSLVKRYQNDVIKITKTKEGYSIDGGKTTAFKNTQVSKGSDKPYKIGYEGASFAAPRALVSDLKLYK